MALAVRPTLLTFAKSLALSQAASPVTQDALKEEEEHWRTKTTQTSEQQARKGERVGVHRPPIAALIPQTRHITAGLF